MVAWLTRVFGPAHLELAEEVVQDALVKALQQWPFTGVPDNPSGWLFKVARNGALDVLRRSAVLRERAPEILRELEERQATEETQRKHSGGSGSGISDDELRMVFMCCHPELPADARVALSLKTVGGFSAAEIARAFLVSETTIAQRIVRAKRTLRQKRIPFELPTASHLTERLDSVLEVIYLMFNEGYAAHGGEDLVRRDLCREALRLGRSVAASSVGTPSADALVALMAFQASRIPSRINSAGELVLLEEQDRSLWDRSLIGMGFAHFERSARGERMTPYHVQAAIAAVHTVAPRSEDTNWPRMLALYDDLFALNPSPIVALNRAAAVARVHGSQAALQEVERLESEPALAGYYLLPAMKGALLLDLGRTREAALAFTEAIARPCSDPERRFLASRLRTCTGTPT